MENPRPRRPPESSEQPGSKPQPVPPVGTRPSWAGENKTKLLLGALLGLLVAATAVRVTAVEPEPACCDLGPQAPENLPHALYSEAMQRIREGEWEEARTLLRKVQELKPDHPSVQEYLARIERELPNQEHLTAARSALAEKKLASDVVAAFPGDRDARAGFEQSQPLPLVESGSPSWDQAVRNFARGEVSSAVTLAQACAPKVPRCKSGLKDLKEFNTLFQKREALNAPQLLRLIKLDLQITGAPVPSRLAQKAGQQLSTIFYKQASMARVAGQWTQAVEYSRKTLHAYPRHAGASSILRELRNKAKDIYLMAYALKDANPEDALPKFREVVAMTSPDDETHQKAQAWIEKLEQMLEDSP